jgi:hypothetical protein
MLLYGEQSLGFSYADNLTIENPYGIFGDGGTQGQAALDKYAPGAVVTGNVVAHPYAPWPAGNEIVDSLLISSDYRTSFTGKGADIDLLTAAQSGSVTAPSPTPTPAPSPSPTPTPVPSPTPSPTPVEPAIGTIQLFSYPSQEGKQKPVLDAMWSQGWRLYDPKVRGELAWFKKER